MAKNIKQQTTRLMELAFDQTYQEHFFLNRRKLRGSLVAPRWCSGSQSRGFGAKKNQNSFSSGILQTGGVQRFKGNSSTSFLMLHCTLIVFWYTWLCIFRMEFWDALWWQKKKDQLPELSKKNLLRDRSKWIGSIRAPEGGLGINASGKNSQVHLNGVSFDSLPSPIIRMTKYINWSCMLEVHFYTGNISYIMIYTNVKCQMQQHLWLN